MNTLRYNLHDLNLWSVVLDSEAAQMIQDALKVDIKPIEILTNLSKIYSQYNQDHKVASEKARKMVGNLFAQFPNITEVIIESNEDEKYPEVLQLNDKTISEEFIAAFRFLHNNLFRSTENKSQFEFKAKVPKILICDVGTYGYSTGGEPFRSYYVFIEGRLKWSQISRYYWHGDIVKSIEYNQYFYNQDDYFSISQDDSTMNFEISIFNPKNDLNNMYKISIARKEESIEFSHTNDGKNFGDSISDLLQVYSEASIKSNQIIGANKQVPLNNIIAQYLL